MGKNSGKSFMNPTDRLRREERRRELKKNKKQRVIVRAALIKGKDPYQIISELERLDKMEFDYYNPPPLNAKVLSDKRRKLKEIWDRVVRLYSKEDKDKFQELKRLESDYEFKRNEMMKSYEAIKSAQEVSLDAIPLPSLPIEASKLMDSSAKPLSILRASKNKTNKDPPGCPSGGPPTWSDYECDESDDYASESEEVLVEDGASKKKKVIFEEDVDNKDNISQFLKEIEQISGDKDEKTEASVKLEHDDSTAVSTSFPATIQPAPPIFDLPNVTASLPAVNASTSVCQLPSRPVHLMPRPLFSHLPTPSMYSTLAGFPQQTPPATRKPEKSQAATIEARPQLRNLSADTTKFMPLSLRIKRDDKQLPTKKVTPKVYGIMQQPSSGSSSRQTKPNSDAYDEFMKEMTGLI